MDSVKLLALLLNGARLLEAAAMFGIDVTEQVKVKIYNDLQIGPDGTIRIDRPNGTLDFVPSLVQREVDAGIHVSKIEAVKMYKSRTGRSLLDSKLAVETYFKSKNLVLKTFSI